MVDKADQLLLLGLSRAVADPAGLPLHGSKSIPGLFPSTNPAKQAAQRCKDEGFLRVVRTETKGKTTREHCGITEKGLAFLLKQVSPKHVLENLVQALESRRNQLGELTALAQQTQASLEGLKATTEKVLQAINKPAASNGFLGLGDGSGAWIAATLTYLAQWQAAKPSEDCPLPELYRQAQQSTVGLTIGHFHDGLRRLHEQERIYLHPWSGPLYEIPEPQYALLVGHEIAYYASLRAA